MESLWLDITNFFENTLKSVSLLDIMDIVIVAIVIYQLLKLIRRTRAGQVLKGVLLLLVFYGITSYIGLQTISWLIGYVLGIGVVAIVILFQPELRAMLERVGRTANIETMRQSGVDESAAECARVIDEMVLALTRLSRRKVGALIVIEQRTGLDDVVATGTLLQARTTAALLENIFEPNTPLHDGAVIMRATQIVAAGCFLRLTADSGLSRELGTRHRAAIGVSEVSDCVSLIVSEESGVISSATGGRMTRYLDEEQLREILSGLIRPRQQQHRGIMSLLRKKGESGDEK